MITVLATNTYKAAAKIKPPRNKNILILNTIRLQESDGRLALTAWLDGEPVTEFVPARVSDPFSTCVPARPFVDWLRVTQTKGKHDLSDQITLSLDAPTQTLKITAGNTRAEFKCIDAREFPEGV